MLDIIILEDDDASASLVARIFAMQGHRARTAARTADAWRLLCDKPADLLVLDTDLGGEWGWEMLERVRRSVVFRELPVIVYSSTWRRDIVRRYMMLGVQGLLVKPYTPARLMAEAERAAESCWREPFFDFPELPAADGPDAARRDALESLHRDAEAILDAAMRLAENCADIALQARVSAVAGRAQAAGFTLLVEVARRMATAAIELKAERLPPLLDDLRLALRFLYQLLAGTIATAASQAPAAASGQTSRSGADDTAAA